MTEERPAAAPRRGRRETFVVFAAAVLVYVAVVARAWLASPSVEPSPSPAPAPSSARGATPSESVGALAFGDTAEDSDDDDDLSILGTMQRLFDARGLAGTIHYYAFHFHPSLEEVSEEEFDAQVLAALRRRLAEEPERAKLAAVDPASLDELVADHSAKPKFDPRNFRPFDFPLARALLPEGAGTADPQVAARLDLIEDAIVDALDDPFTQVVRGGTMLGSMILELLQIPSDLGVLVEPVAGGGFELGVVLRDTDAAAKGLRAGDRLLAVDGVAVQGLRRHAVQAKVARRCRMTIQRDSIDPPVELDVRTSNPMTVPTCAALLDGDVGYLAFPLFRQGAFAELIQAGRGLAKRGARAFVLDLRGNPGGLIAEAGTIASLFLSEGVLIGQLEMRLEDGIFGLDDELVAARPAFPDVPLFVLIDGSSASASEILAAALDDHGRAMLVGSRTYGKGVGQILLSFPIFGSEAEPMITRMDAFVLTVLALRSPDGRDWHGRGIEPDLRAAPAEETRERIVKRAALLDDPGLLESLAEIELAESDVELLRSSESPAIPSAITAAAASGLPCVSPHELAALGDVLRLVQRARRPELAACPALDPALKKALAAARLKLR